ncbi:MATE family efflux transporter [Spectribacter hydrogenoxidans]|uniref:Multidrug-efflux transporter n=1 Tax=Spectribacter hydrogenoxidans TaxID=3075608 RepID=A0ABU3BZ49_9GAMM|nr:MATE family efflux transporter [Salinisphaera sp. W335]MDT0634591.1 MATE family efflux transporter [Salinisphaera sp. W335]
MPMLPPSPRTRRILVLALPIVGGMTSQNLLNLVDTAMVGALGPAALAAVGMASFLSFMAVAMVIGLSTGVQAIAARRYGEGRFDETAVPLNGGLLLALLLGLPISVVVFIFAPDIFAALNEDAAVVREGTPYLQARCLAVAAVGMNFSFRGYWSAVDQPRLYLYTLLVMHTANIVISYLLIFGVPGIPALGTLGAGIGTAASTVLGTLIYFRLARRRADAAGFLHRRPDWRQLGRQWRLSLPASAQQFLFAAGLTALFWILAQVGTRELAVANVLINVTLVAVLPAIGLGLAAASLVGQSLGRRDPAEAHRWGWDVVRVGGLVLALLGAPMLLVPDLILGVFLHQPDLLDLGRLPLRIIGAGIAVDGIGLILMHGLLGAGATGPVMRVALGLQWLFFLPLAWLMGTQWGLGLLAIWLVFIGSRVLQTLVFAWLWQRRGWQRIEV